MPFTSTLTGMSEFNHFSTRVLQRQLKFYFRSDKTQISEDVRRVLDNFRKTQKSTENKGDVASRTERSSRKTKKNRKLVCNCGISSSFVE